MSNIFEYYPTKKKLKGIVSIPHSGEEIPEIFMEYLTSNMRDLAEDVDYRVFELIDRQLLLDSGISIMQANIHRTCVDLNRAPECAVLNWKCNSQGTPIVTKEPVLEWNERVLDDYYRPYFDFLEELINQSGIKKIPVIDYHSMPSKPTPYHLKQNPDQSDTRPDFCLSDLNGKSCDPDFITFAVTSFKDAGQSATMNEPYLGGFLTKFINRFDTNNIQIETNRALYMDELNRELKQDEVTRLRPIVTKVVVDTILKFSE